jgi:hypothetical protein
MNKRDPYIDGIALAARYFCMNENDDDAYRMMHGLGYNIKHFRKAKIDSSDLELVERCFYPHKNKI